MVVTPPTGKKNNPRPKAITKIVNHFIQDFLNTSKTLELQTDSAFDGTFKVSVHDFPKMLVLKISE